MSQLNRSFLSLSVAAGLVLVSHAATADITLTFADSATAGVTGTDFTFSTCNIDFLAGREFRMCDPSGALGGGLPLQKNALFGGEEWIFSDAGIFTSVSGTTTNPGVDCGTVPGSAACNAGTNVTLQQDASFFGSPFNFLAPVQGSLAGNAYGIGSIALDLGENSITGDFPVLEAQWANTWFPLGLNNDKGISMSGAITNLAYGVGTLTFDYKIAGEHLIDATEDPGIAGFGGWTAQWYLVGSGSMPLQSPMASAGAIAPPVGSPAESNVFDDGRLSLAELGANPDADVFQSCVGGCFDFEVTGIGGPTVRVVLPLSAPAPSDPGYRKYDTGAGTWSTFIEDGVNDIVESVQGSLGNCPAPNDASYNGSPLTEGHYCVRLTISDNGPNDTNPNAGDIADPGGVGGGAPPAPPATTYPPAPGERISGGCSLGGTTTAQRLDLWLIGGLLAGLGLYRRRLM